MSYHSFVKMTAISASLLGALGATGDAGRILKAFAGEVPVPGNCLSFHHGGCAGQHCSSCYIISEVGKWPASAAIFLS